MKREEKKALVEKSVEELQSQLQELQKELVVSRLAVRAGKEPDTSKPDRLGRSIAIVKTVLRNKKNAPDVIQSQSGKKAK